MQAGKDVRREVRVRSSRLQVGSAVPGSDSSFWRRGLVAWVAMAMAMTANGIVRETVIKRFVRRGAADAISAASGIALMQLIARQTLRGTSTPSRNDVKLLAATWLCMTVTFEFVVGRTVDRKSWAELIDNYNVFEGKLWPVVLASLFAAPFFWSKR
jgi:hypothetical protein